MGTGSGGAAAGDERGVFCGPGAPFPGLSLRRRKRGSRMSPGGGGSDRERGGGGRRRRARATATSEAAAAARATAQARGRQQVSVAEDRAWAGEAGRHFSSFSLSLKPPFGGGSGEGRDAPRPRHGECLGARGLEGSVPEVGLW